MRKACMWLWLLTKRLYKKPTFLALLLLVPVLLLGYSGTAGEDSGVLTIVLASSGEDALVRKTMDKLERGSELIRFVRSQEPAEAEDMVRYGKADAAWIFPEQMQQKVDAFVRDPEGDTAIVQVVQQEESVLLRMTREKLSAALFAACSHNIYLDYARENGLEHLSEEELLSKYEASVKADNLFDFSDVEAAAENVTYLTAPIRGLLAVVIVLGGLATAMYDLHDRRKGTFGWVAQEKRAWVELGCQMISVLNICLVVLISLLISGLCGNVLRELAVLLMYAVCTAVFSMLLRRLCGGQRVLAVLLPVLVMAMVGLCPVFFDLTATRQLQLILPPTYYIQGLHNGMYLLRMVGYTLVCGGLYWLLGRCKRQ